MKYAYSLLFALLTPLAFAQGIPIQLMVVDGDGFEMPNKQVKLRLTLTNDTSLTSGQYQEVHSITTSDLGIASVELGSGITTSNSQTLDLGLFNFQEVEPFIKTELDTNLSPTQYIELGWMRYNYPLIAQRALKADSSAYSLDASFAKYSDTAEFARNFEETIDNDTSAQNELQSLYLTDEGYLKLSESNDSVRLYEDNDMAGFIEQTEYCIQGNPEAFKLDVLSSFDYVSPLLVFDSLAFFIGRSGSGSTAIKSLFYVDLYANTILSYQSMGYWSSAVIGGAQNDSVGYLFDSTKIYVIDEYGQYADTINYSGFTSGSSFCVFKNGDAMWLSGNSIKNLNRSTGLISSVLTSTTFNNYDVLNPIGNDSVIISNKIYNRNFGTILKTFSSGGGYNYNPVTNKIYYIKGVGQYQYYEESFYSNDLDELNEELLVEIDRYYYRFNSSTTATIRGMPIISPTYAGAGDSQYANGAFYNNYWYEHGHSIKLCIKPNGNLLEVVRGDIGFKSLGKYTVSFNTSVAFKYRCISGSDINTYYTLLRWPK